MVERGNEAVGSGEVSGQTSWYAGKSDEDIVRDTVSWLAEEMRSMMIYREYPEIYERAVTILEKWRRSFPKGVWIRVVKSGRIAKELNECAPVIQHAMDRVAKMPTRQTPTNARRSSIYAAGLATSACSSRRCWIRQR